MEETLNSQAVEEHTLRQNGKGEKGIAQPAMPSLRVCALAALATQVYSLISTDSTPAEHRFLLTQLEHVGGPGMWRQALARARAAPLSVDGALVELGTRLALTDAELLTVALCAAVEEDAMSGRVLAYLQQPMGGSRPMLGLVARAFFDADEATPPIYSLLNGAAMRSGLLTLLNEGAPLPERAFAIPQTLAMALYGVDGSWPGASCAADPAPLRLPAALLEGARQRARTLAVSSIRLLILRGGELEARGLATEMVTALGKRALFLTPDAVTKGLGVYLQLRNLIPVFFYELAPGEQKQVPDIPFYYGPLLACCGIDGAIEIPGGAALNWAIPAPNCRERSLLWQEALGDEKLAAELARNYRHGSARIAHLGQLAHYQARLRGGTVPEADDILAAAWSSDGGGLATLAQPLPEPIPNDALVTTPALRRDLAALLLRCRSRDGLVDGLGASAKARYRPGVRALFVGGSGAGKTLAVGWLATQLGLPLYRVDLAAVTSKFIGETEKNLAQLLARAEQSEVVLLFDEADSLFGKRTDVQQANDRFANAQTNYLLQRIESYEGIAILTSNSRSRFDPAFMRRLDAIVDFPTPGPQERRALWLAHLGQQHTLDGQQINRLAAASDLAGGHIRNVVLLAAVLAQSHARPIEYCDVLAGLTDEYRKLGRQLPVEL